MAVTPATDGGPDAVAVTVPTPDAGTPTPGCTTDVECKGQRICVMGTCTDPPVQPVVDAGNDVVATDQPDAETMAIDAAPDTVPDALPDAGPDSAPAPASTAPPPATCPVIDNTAAAIAQVPPGSPYCTVQTPWQCYGGAITFPTTPPVTLMFNGHRLSCTSAAAPCPMCDANLCCLY